MRKPLLALCTIALAVLACSRSQPEIIIITATFPPPPGATLEPAPNAATPIQPTADPARLNTAPREYVVRPGDTLSAIASAHGVSVASMLEVNPLPNPNLLEVGQVLRLPDPPTEEGSDFKIIADGRLVRGPGSSAFDVADFIARQPGFIRTAVDTVSNQLFTAAEIVERVALEYSVDARLLLALLEYRAGWLSDPEPDEQRRIYPLGAQPSPLGFDRNGLYRQLTWGADRLNFGYYGWKYRGLNSIEFTDGVRLLYARSLNAGTVGVQYLLAQYADFASWQRDVAETGFYQTYVRYFGDPFAGVVDPLVPPGLAQPPLTLPFPQGETWFFTGGPHGGWGSGSAWAAVDFAPPDDLTTVTSACYISSHFATAVAPGIIARTDVGTVILDLDGDGDETTGWSILYLHIAEQDRIAPGTRVNTGDRIGRPSCEGGVSTGTHIHIARRYNGEWIPSSCEACAPGVAAIPFVMSEWTVVGLPGQQYQGYLTRGAERRIAEQGRLSAENRVSW